MSFVIKAACGCNKGKIRKNNEDNFYFDGKCLEVENDGLKNPAYIETPAKRGLCYAIFDGMGGENFGEIASFAVARQMQQIQRTLIDYFTPENKYLLKLSMRLNDAVLQAKKLQLTDRMGTTMVLLSFSGQNAYVCNVGDSRAYRLREGELLQLSKDHIAQRPGREHKKAPLTQHLGINAEDMLIVPHIDKVNMQAGDRYLLCSDGLTDMLNDMEITRLLNDYPDILECTNRLIHAALEKGGRDNITVIVCKVSG